MTSLLKKAASLAMAGVATLTLGMSAAKAATTDLGTVTSTTTTSTATTSGSFADLYDFSVVANSGSAVASSAVTFSSYGVSISSIALYAGTYTSVADLAGLTAVYTSSNVTTTSLGNGVYADSVAGGTSSLSTDTGYTLVVTGTSSGSSAYTTIVALAPVPEPESYSMMAAGLGLMGLLARRRSKKRG